jgi:hypothetical protein
MITNHPAFYTPQLLKIGFVEYPIDIQVIPVNNDGGNTIV